MREISTLSNSPSNCSTNQTTSMEASTRASNSNSTESCINSNDSKNCMEKPSRSSEMSIFTKRHYQIIASAIKASNVRTDVSLEEILCRIFEDDNPRFLKEIFLEAIHQW